MAGNASEGRLQSRKLRISRSNFRGASILRCGSVRHLRMPYSSNLDVLRIAEVGLNVLSVCAIILDIIVLNMLVTVQQMSF